MQVVDYMQPLQYRDIGINSLITKKSDISRSWAAEYVNFTGGSIRIAAFIRENNMAVGLLT